MRNKRKLPCFIMASCSCILLALILSCVSSADKIVQAAASIDELTSVDNKLIWLKANAESNSNYVFEVNGSERIRGGDGTFTPVSNTNLSYKDKTNITITIRGVGSNAELLPRDSRQFIVDSGVTLILENIVIRGPGTNTSFLTGRSGAPLITISSGGTLVMNDGSVITGNDNPGSGGGVYISNGGKFLMNGGLITNNRASITTAIMGVMDVAYGGGVYVSVGGTFTKTGGIITGYASDQSNGNVVWILNDSDPYRAPFMEPAGNSHGHAVYAQTGQLSGIFIRNAGSRRKERTADPNDNLHIGSDGTFSGNWDY